MARRAYASKRTALSRLLILSLTTTLGTPNTCNIGAVNTVDCVNRGGCCDGYLCRKAQAGVMTMNCKSGWQGKLMKLRHPLPPHPTPSPPHSNCRDGRPKHTRSCQTCQAGWPNASADSSADRKSNISTNTIADTYSAREARCGSGDGTATMKDENSNHLNRSTATKYLQG